MVCYNSQPLSGHSDSPTSSSHLDDDVQDVTMLQDTDFIDDDSQQPPDNSQLPGEAASLSQEIAALSSVGSLSASRIQRPPPGTYSGQNDNDNEYEDTSDDDEDSNLPSAVTSNPSSRSTTGVQPTAAATPSAATTAAPAIEPASPASSGPAIREVATGFVAHRFNRSTVPGHPAANAFAVREAAQPHGGIPVGASRYLLPAWWKSHNEAHMLWAENSLEAALARRLASCTFPRDFVLFFQAQKSEGGQKAVDVYCASNELFLALQWQSITLDGNGTLSTTIMASARCGLPLSPRYIQAKVFFANCSDDEEAVAIFEKSFARATGVFVIEAWTIHKKFASGSLRFKNGNVALLYIPPFRGQGSFRDGHTSFSSAAPTAD